MLADFEAVRVTKVWTADVVTALKLDSFGFHVN
jgi:hypothetical protein